MDFLIIAYLFELSRNSDFLRRPFDFHLYRVYSTVIEFSVGDALREVENTFEYTRQQIIVVLWRFQSTIVLPPTVCAWSIVSAAFERIPSKSR